MVTLESDFLKIEDNFAKTKDIRSICMVERISHKDAKVTIAIPTYKGGEALVHAVNSALAQVGYDRYVLDEMQIPLLNDMYPFGVLKRKIKKLL